MSTITKDLMEKAFEIFESGSKNITPLVNMGMNENSASMTFTWFDRLLTGELYKRHASAMQVEWILATLYKNNDVKRLSLALKSLNKYISYYQDVPLNKIKEIVKEFEKKIDFIEDEKTIIYPDEIELNQTNLREGATKNIVVNAYERNPHAKKQCISKYGHNCSVCGFNFKDIFGEIGDNFIHVHHLRPISESNKEYVINPIKDLRPVCPNCHAMIHKRKKPYSIDELKEIININRT